jgi:N-acetylmuramoyl-L-alanine amidase
MAENQVGWVPDTAITMLAAGASLPHSYVKQISTAGYTDHTTVTIGTTGRHPFKIEEELANKTITVFLFGVDGDTDWIRYDSRDSLVSRIEWSQVQSGVYRVKIYLTAGNIWGYDAHYNGNEFNLDIKRYPSGKPRLADCRIVVDPGHSPDPGASGPTGLKEKDANLDIAKQLKKVLEREGADVVLTRSNDSPVPLYDRPKIAVIEKADLFISIHNNALPDGINPFANNGVSTYYYQPHSAALAHSVQKSLAAELNMNDFGWYYSNLAVNRPTQYPAILVECAFMMIPEQEALLRTEKFQKKVAGAIADGVKEFFKNQAMGGER